METKLAKKERHKVYQKALEMASDRSEYSEHNISDGLCCLLQDANNKIKGFKEIPFYWETKGVFTEFTDFLKSGHYEYNDGFRIMVLQLCYLMTR